MTATRLLTRLAPICLAGLLATLPAHAEDAASAATAPAADAEPAGEMDPFHFAVGAFFVQRTNGVIRLDRTTGALSLGASVDWERDLDGETSMTVPRVDGYYRFAPKHRLDYSWFRIDREGSKTLDRDFSIGDEDYLVGTTVNSEFTTETIKAVYSYSFYRAPEIEVALSAGFHVTMIDFEIESTNSAQRTAESVTAPLPVIGFRLAYSPSPKWWVKSNYELFFLDQVEDAQGSMSDFTLTLEYEATRHLGIGGGLNRSGLQAEYSGSDFTGRTDSVLNGFLLYLVLR